MSSGLSNSQNVDPRVANAIRLFESAPVGQQLADPAETNGRCGRASGRFISALRDCGTDGTFLEWADEDEQSWHQAVLLPDGDTVVDWTASQFEVEQDPGLCPYPRIESLDTAVERWGKPARIDPDDKQARWLHDIPELMQWSDAQEPIPAQGSAEERETRG